MEEEGYMFQEQPPFWRIQRNGLMQDLRIPEHLSMPPHLYLKPAGICYAPDSIWQKANPDEDPYEFSYRWRKDIQARVADLGLSFKNIQSEDTSAIKDFLNRRYPKRLADEICAFDLFRFREYGHGIILVDDGGIVRGTIFEEKYDTAEKTSFTIRLAIDVETEGHNLGLQLMRYSVLRALETGSRVKRGLIEFGNLRSLYINLNKVGWICDGFEPHISSLGSFFRISLPLDPQGVTSNCIDLSKIGPFLAARREGIDYRIIDVADFAGVRSLYESGEFVIVALLRHDEVVKRDSFLALTKETIQYRPK